MDIGTYGSAEFFDHTAFPWAIGSTLTLVCQVFFAAWFVAVGLKLYGMRELADTGHSDLRASPTEQPG